MVQINISPLGENPAPCSLLPNFDPSHSKSVESTKGPPTGYTTPVQVPDSLSPSVISTVGAHLDASVPSGSALPAPSFLVVAHLSCPKGKLVIEAEEGDNVDTERRGKLRKL